MERNGSHALKCIYTNIDGLNSTKGSELNIIVHRESPDIVCLAETKLTDNCTLSQFVDCADYHVFRKDRRIGCGGGVLIMVKKPISSDELLNEAWDDVEVVVCQLRFGRHLLIVACMYRPPGSQLNYNAQIRKSLRAVTASKQDQVLICGDFNYREINWHDNEVNGGVFSEQAKFLDECANSYLYQHVMDFTRVRGEDRPSVLDLVLTRNELEVTKLEYVAPIGSSDHCLLSFLFSIEGATCSYNHTPRRNFQKGNYAKASKIFDDVNWENILSQKRVNDAWDIFLTHYQNAISQTVPFYPDTRRKQGKKKWITREVLKHVRKKEEAWVRLRKNRKSKRLKEIYTQIRNTATRVVRKAKFDFEHKLAREIKSDPKGFYSYARSKTSIKEEILMVKREDGSMTKNLAETCEEMNDQFQKVFNRTGNITPTGIDSYNGVILESCDVAIDNVLNALLQLKTPSAPGPDGVHPTVLKSCARSLAKPMSIIFQKSLDARS